MKKLMKVLGSMALIFSLAACGVGTQAGSDKLQVVTTSYALKYFIEEIGKDQVEVVYSLTSNPHHFELSQADAQKIANADIFFNVEAGDYISIGEQIKNVNKNMTVVDVAEHVALIPYVGHYHIHEDEAEEHTHDHEEEEHTHEEEVTTLHDDEAKEDFDPHIWLDPIKAKQIVTNIKEALLSNEKIDNASIGENAGALQEKLALLDDKLHDTLTNLTTPYIVVSHAAYGYLANHYHFAQEAVNSAMDHSENTQSSMIEIDNFIAEHNIKYIFTESNMEANSAIDVLVSKHNLTVLTLHNLETPVDATNDYFELMEMNLTQLEQAMK